MGIPNQFGKVIKKAKLSLFIRSSRIIYRILVKECWTFSNNKKTSNNTNKKFGIKFVPNSKLPS